MFEEFINLLKAFVFGELYRLLGFLENNMRRIQGSTLEYSVSVNVIFGKNINVLMKMYTLRVCMCMYIRVSGLTAAKHTRENIYLILFTTHIKTLT